MCAASLIPPLQSEGQVLAETNGCLGLITLNRANALNALSLAMIRDLTALLKTWATAPGIEAVVILGAGREGGGGAAEGGRGAGRAGEACGLCADGGAVDRGL